MKVHCRTNLDIQEKWPTELPCCPHVGDRIESSVKHRNSFRLTMKIDTITWRKTDDYNGYEGSYYPEIELIDCWPVPRSIRQIYEWYAPLVGRSVSAFI